MDLRTTATNIRIARSTVTTTCSGCSARTAVDVEDGVASVENGLRGSVHAAAHVAVADVMLSGGLLLWTCPACGYAESFEWEA